MTFYLPDVCNKNNFVLYRMQKTIKYILIRQNPTLQWQMIEKLSSKSCFIVK
jgi:hypothetical protein